MNNFAKLLQSTLDLHNQFETVQQSQKIFTEEYNKVLNAVTNNESVERIAEEFVDSLVTVIGIFRSLSTSEFADYASVLFFTIKSVYELYIVIRKNHVSAVDIEKATIKVVEKNNSKTLETHVWNSLTGKITRKENK